MSESQFQQKRSDPALWFNIISIIVLSVPVILAAIEKIQPGWAVLADSIGTLIVGIGNIVIRYFFTDKPLDTARNREKAADQSGKVHDPKTVTIYDLEDRLKNVDQRR